MGLQLSSVGRGKILGGALFFIALGAYQGYESVNHALNYAEVAARATEVKPLWEIPGTGKFRGWKFRGHNT